MTEGPVAEQTMLEVPALKVSPVLVKKLTGVVLLNVTVELPRLIVRVLLLFEISCVAVTLKLLVVKVPAVTVNGLEDVKASARVTVTAFIVVLPSVVPEDVTVLVLINVIARDVYVPPVARVRLPAIFTFDELTVHVLPVKIRLLM